MKPSNPFIQISLFLALLIGLSFASYAQLKPKLQDPQNPFLLDKALDMDIAGGVIYFKVNALHPGELFTTYRSNTGMGQNDTMKNTKVWHDSMLAEENSPAPNLTHTLYQQYYKDIEVEGASIIEHGDGENVWYTSGFFVEGINANIEASFTEAQAIESCKLYLNAETYSWDSSGILPKGKLILIHNGTSETSRAEDFILAWKFTIVTLNPSSNNELYIHANTGKVVKQLTNEYSGSFNHLYYGTRYDLDTHYKGTWFYNSFYLHANDDNRNIITIENPSYDGPGSYGYDWFWDGSTTPYSAGDDVWVNDNWASTASHYCASKSWDYFKQTSLNRNGPSGWGDLLHVKADDQTISNGTLAVYTRNNNKDYIQVGRKNNYLCATFDIIGHEFTHGIIKNSQPLPTEKISGAIGESFGDIFGFMVERYAFGYVRNWTLGEDMNSIQRNMQYPNLYNQASYFQEPGKWYNISSCMPNSVNDFCGIHINGGVQNKWFYLLSNGGSQLVFGSPRTCLGIGIDKAARISFYTMVNSTNYSLSNLTYDVVRANSIASARALYGICSNEENATQAAWYAVNVGVNLPCALAGWYTSSNNSLTGFEKTANQGVFKVSLTPNPVNSTATFNIEESGLNSNHSGYLITISDANGRIQSTKTFSDNTNLTINLEDLMPGLYIAQIACENWSKTIKFTKQ